MNSALCIAASLSPDIRQDIGIQVLSRSQPISHIAATYQVSRKFVYQQGDKAQQALDESFAPSKDDDDVLFHLPVTKNWLFQLILGLVLICHSSYRGVVELFRDMNCGRSVSALSTIVFRKQQSKRLRLTNHKTLLALRWVFRLKFTKPINLCWWALMQPRRTATY
ncbi:MAG: hypothetical protein AAGC93_19845 [Cyanobacteria bacterium P01_F01_bin.53]